MPASYNLSLNSSSHLQDTSIKPTKASVSKNCKDYSNKIHLSEIIKFTLKGLAFIATLGIGYIIGKQIYLCLSHLNSDKDTNSQDSKNDASEIDSSDSVDFIDSSDSSDSSDLSILLVGMTGYGKSSMGNSILGKEVFSVSPDMVSETNKCQIETCKIDGRQITVIDTPGFFGVSDDTHDYPVKIAQELLKGAFNSPYSKEGFDAIIFVLQYGDRMTAERMKVLDECQNMFGQDVLQKHGVIAMTKGDLARENWMSTVKGAVTDYVKKCQNRLILFDNWTEDETKLKTQREHLFKYVRSIRRNNKRYLKKDLQKSLEAYIRVKEPKTIDKIHHELADVRAKIEYFSKIEELSKRDVDRFTTELYIIKGEIDTIDAHNPYKVILYEHLDRTYAMLPQV